MTFHKVERRIFLVCYQVELPILARTFAKPKKMRNNNSIHILQCFFSNGDFFRKKSQSKNGLSVILCLTLSWPCKIARCFTRNGSTSLLCHLNWFSSQRLFHFSIMGLVSEQEEEEWKQFPEMPVQ